MYAYDEQQGSHHDNGRKSAIYESVHISQRRSTPLPCQGYLEPFPTIRVTASVTSSGTYERPVPCGNLTYERPVPCGNLTYERPVPCGNLTYERPAPCGNLTYERPVPCGNLTYERPVPCGNLTYERPVPCGNLTYERPVPCGSLDISRNTTALENSYEVPKRLVGTRPLSNGGVEPEAYEMLPSHNQATGKGAAGRDAAGYEKPVTAAQKVSWI